MLKEVDTGPASQQEVPISDDPSSKNPPPEGRSADHLPYGVDTIVIPFTWSDRQEASVSGDPSSQDLPPEGRSAGDLPYGVDTIRLRISWPAAPALRGYNGRMWRMRPLRGWTGAARQDAPGADEGTGDRDGLAVTGPGHAPTFPEQGQVVPANQAIEGGGPASELLAAFRALRAGALQGRGPTAKEADAGLSGGSGADGGWGSSASNTEGFGTIAPDQATAMLASSPLRALHRRPTQARQQPPTQEPPRAPRRASPTTRPHPCRLWTTRAGPS